MGYGRGGSYHQQRETIARQAPAKQRRYSFGTHANTCHVWAQQNPDTHTGQSGDGRIRFEGDTIYSYGSHFPMARFVGAFQGRRVVLLNSDSYSVSTSAHQSECRSAFKRGEGDADILIPLPTEYIRATLSSAQRNAAQEWILEGIARRARRVWGTAPDSWERRELTEYRSALAAFRALFKPRAKVPVSVVAWLVKRENAAERKRLRARLNDAYAVVRQVKRCDLANPSRPEPGANTWTLEQGIRELQRTASKITSARMVLGRAKAARSTIQTLSAARQALKAARAPWDQALEQARAREARDHDLHMIAELKAGRPTWRAGQASELGRLWAVAIREADQDAAALIGRLCHIEQWQREVPATFKQYQPPIVVTPEQWEAGQGRAHDAYRFSGTLVRRRGDNLETSQGATCPWGHAVLAFRKAQQCRARGETYERNGHTLHVGHFAVDRIGPDGTLKAGCHVIRFADMLRCAVREVPSEVKPAYPLPAVI